MNEGHGRVEVTRQRSGWELEVGNWVRELSGFEQRLNDRVDALERFSGELEPRPGIVGERGFEPLQAADLAYLAKALGEELDTRGRIVHGSMILRRSATGRPSR